MRWTGDPAYADYWERNLFNGILAQQHPNTGQVAYFLPMRSGAVKQWGTPTRDFWCCHGTLVQAHTIHPEHIYYQCAGGLAVAQWIPSRARWQTPEGAVEVTVKEDPQTGQPHRPHSRAFNLAVACASPRAFALRLRIPWWVQGQASITLNGQPLRLDAQPGSFASLQRTWGADTLRIEFPTALTLCPLPDAPQTAAFMDGPTVLAGLYGPGSVEWNETLEEHTLTGDPAHPETILAADNEREWGEWRSGYRTRGQAVNRRFIPLNEVEDERYGVYFQVKP